jgi:TP901 family phage tail tape measure protein
MREVEARLKLSAVDKTGGAFNSMASKLERVSQKAEAFNKRIMATSQRMSMVAPTMAAAAAVVMRQGLLDFADMERKMTRIGITAEASAEETKAAFETIQNETKKLGLPLDQGIAAMDTLTASGMRMGEALAFLPSVLMTTQASGAAAEDIANAGLKAASAFKIEAKNMQRAFDEMAYSGKNGQFELRNMAAYLPSLATQFASLGYKGEDGLKRLLGMLQTLRAHTGTAEEAKTYAENIMLKMTSPATIKSFAKFRINLMKELDSASREGEDKMHAFIRLSLEATKGDIGKFNQLFEDSQLQTGMKVLASFPEELAKNIELLNSTQVDGTNFRDAQRLVNDTTSSLERFSQSWDRFKRSIGEKVAPAATTAMDIVSDGQDVGNARDKGMNKLGWGMLHRMVGPVNEDEWFKVLRAGGYDAPGFREKYQGHISKNMKGRSVTSFVAPPEFPGGGHGYKPTKLPETGPVPQGREAALRDSLEQLYAHNGGRGVEPTSVRNTAPSQTNGFNAFAGFENTIAAIGKNAGADLESSGQKAGKAIADGMSGQASEVGRQIGAAILAEISAGIRSIVAGVPKVNADTGRSMPPSSGQPAKFGP